MARRRFLQPGFWSNPLLSKCPPLTRMMFQVIWTHADFDGAFQWDPEALAMKGLPRDNFDAAEALNRLEGDGFIRSYVVEGKCFGYVVNWHKHQDPHPGEKPVYPKPFDAPGFIVKVKPPKYREKADTGFGHDEVPVGLHQWMQLAEEFPAAFLEKLQGYTPATDKEGKEGKEGKESPGQEMPVHRVEPVLRNSVERKKKPAPWEQTLSDEVVTLANYIFRLWPDGDRKQPNGKDYVPRSSKAKLAARLSDLHKQGVDLDVCLAIAKRFTQEFDQCGMWAKAAENFFGKVDDAPWIAYYQAHQTNVLRQKEEESEAARRAEDNPFEEVS